MKKSKNLLYVLAIIFVVGGLKIVKHFRVKRELKKLDELNIFINQKTEEMNNYMKESFKRNEEETRNLMKRLRYQIVVKKYDEDESFPIGSLFASFDDALDAEMELYKNSYDPRYYYITIKHVFIEEE